MVEFKTFYKDDGEPFDPEYVRKFIDCEFNTKEELDNFIIILKNTVKDLFYEKYYIPTTDEWGLFYSDVSKKYSVERLPGFTSEEMAHEAYKESIPEFKDIYDDAYCIVECVHPFNERTYDVELYRKVEE